MIKFLIEKEFKQIRRHSFIPKLILMMPILMMLILPWAANQEVRDLKISVVDNDRSTLSQRLIHKISASEYFHLVDISPSNYKAMESIESGNADIVVEIQHGFEKELLTVGVGQVLVSANSVNGTKGSLGSAYIIATLQNFTDDIRIESLQQMGSSIPLIKIMPVYKFNPHLDYKVFMVPALMVMLLTLLTGFLPALNIVSEKEVGTIEQMNVTPVNKFIFILAKLIPYWFIGVAVLTICFGIAALVYGLFPLGSLLTVYLFACVYIFVMSGLGLVISNYSSTMQQAMFVMFFFLMVMILMSGLFTPINSMPEWAQVITRFNPLSYFILVMRMVYLKGSSFGDLSAQMLALCGFALTFSTWAVLSYRKSN